MRAARRVKASFVKQKRYAEAAAIDFIIDDYDVDTSSLRHERKDGTTFTPNEHYCQRCGAQTINCKFHTFYECPDNEDIVEWEVVSTQKLCKIAKADWDNNRCLWARGLLPGDQARPEGYRRARSYEEVKIVKTSNFVKLAMEEGGGATDGAGAPTSIPPQCRRVSSGGAASTIDPDSPWEGGEYGGFWAPVPGRQTVPRAELWATILFLHAIPRPTSMTLLVDASYVVSGFRNIQDRMKGSNGDMWTVLFDIVRERQQQGGASSVTKVKAHQDKVAILLKEQVDDRKMLLNALADGAADKGGRGPQRCDARFQRCRRQHK